MFDLEAIVATRPVLQVRASNGEWCTIQPGAVCEAGLILQYPLWGGSALLLNTTERLNLVRWSQFDAIRPLLDCSSCGGRGHMMPSIHGSDHVCPACGGHGTRPCPAWAESEPIPGPLMPDDPF